MKNSNSLLFRDLEKKRPLKYWPPVPLEKLDMAVLDIDDDALLGGAKRLEEVKVLDDELRLSISRWPQQKIGILQYVVVFESKERGL
jgi:hypothetical protein